MRVVSALFVGWSVAGLVGCDAGGGGPNASMVRDSAGVEIVTNFFADGWSAEDAPRVVEELRIGVLDGDPRYMFGNVPTMGLDVDEEGRIYALDGGAKVIKVFDADGEYLYELGGPGRGPGEFVTPMMMTVLNHEVRVLDAGAARIQRFDRNGRDRGSETLVAGVSISYRLPSDSEYLEWHQPLPVGLEYQDYLVIRRSVTDDASDTILKVPPILALRMDGAKMRLQVNTPTPAWAVAGDRLLLAKSSEFRIEEWSLKGDLARVFSLDVEPTPLTPARREELLNALPPMFSEDAEVVNSFNPVLGNLMAGPRDTRWVQGRDVNAPVDKPNYVWYVFDDDGRFLGTLELPARFSPALSRHDRIYGVQRDDLGVSYVVRLRIEGL